MFDYGRDGKYNQSRVWTDEVGYIDTTIRDSASAVLKSDEVVKRIMKRARSLMGWRNNDTRLQPMTLQRYEFNGFFTFHYDWIDDDMVMGNRMTTFMVYLVDKCTGGGTNFPRLQAPGDPRWCDIIACEGDVEHEEYPGVTFKPIAGSAVYWENFHPNGTPHTGTRHAALPVRSGEKVGMNIWSWDNSWRLPVAEKDD
jgi:prolyl 4-hydroxylase